MGKSARGNSAQEKVGERSEGEEKHEEDDAALRDGKGKCVGL
jgi:hypothetical protein